ncbi:phosphatase domain-containing putative toxin [Rhodopirellula bahusiensis]|uniref:phosphatase domain-containing putative toxin n=1 Tax=Rhodopirellula bahusiensis TaxID=2014065 RepID=UPI001E2F71FE|nr:hypothetical protein [Rhodopirellula bahusiensis]
MKQSKPLIRSLLGAIGILSASLLCFSYANADESRKADKQTAAHAPSALENRIEVHPSLMSGAAPHGEAAFAELASLGVKVVVSVDGQRPDIELARKHGLRYIHIPIGYDGVHEQACKAAVALTDQIQEPMYVHCHHGKHRGPAMAAVIAQTAGWLDRKQAIELLKNAGTGSQYAGLWRDVDGFRPQPDSVEIPELVEVAQISTLASHMVDTSLHYEVLLKSMRSNDWKVGEVRLLQEALRESHRVCNEEMRPWMKDSVELVHSMESQVEREDYQELSESMARLKKACNQCHERYRN